LSCVAINGALDEVDVAGIQLQRIRVDFYRAMHAGSGLYDICRGKKIARHIQSVCYAFNSQFNEKKIKLS